MRKILSIFLTFNLSILVCSSLVAQENSPYSLYGPGIRFNNAPGIFSGMGNAGIALPSDMSLNYSNPASFSGIDSLSFIFEAGINSSAKQFRLNNNNYNSYTSNLGSIGLGFRMNKYIGFSAGVNPYSSLNYNFLSSRPIEGLNTNQEIRYIGKGGVNKVYLGTSLRIIKGLAFGANLNYYFGALSYKETTSESETEFWYEYYRKDQVRGVNADFGVLFGVPVKGWTISGGATYSNGINLGGKGGTWLIVAYDSAQISSRAQPYSVSEQFGFGLGLSKSYNLKVALDYKYAFAPEQTPGVGSASFRDGQVYRLGIQYTPWKTFRDRGLRRMYYRLGFEYEESCLIAKSIPLDAWSVSMGLGLPFRNEPGTLNLSFNFEKYGTEAYNLPAEYGIGMKIHLSLQDKWFRKSLFD